MLHLTTDSLYKKRDKVFPPPNPINWGIHAFFFTNKHKTVLNINTRVWITFEFSKCQINFLTPMKRKPKKQV